MKHRAAGKSSAKALSARQRSRRARRQRRLALLKLEPQRVEEIQRALVHAGYLSHEPTGKWDEPTRVAMRRYQAANGFHTTGLPEAKSLMKLGLGPHALPEDADPSAAARAGVNSSAQDNASTDLPPGQDPGSPHENQ